MSNSKGNGWALLVDNDPYGSLSEKRTKQGDRWLRFETGPAIGILPIKRVGGKLHVLLIEEDKPILGKSVLKIASDYLRKRPNTEDTARDILAQKTGIRIQGVVVRLFETMPSYYPNAILNISLYIGYTWSHPPDGEEKSLVTPWVFGIREAVDCVLHGEIKDVFSVYVLLLLEAMDNRGVLG